MISEELNRILNGEPTLKEKMDREKRVEWLKSIGYKFKG